MQSEPTAGTIWTNQHKRYLDKIEELQLLSISMVPPCLDLAEKPNNSSV